jgi:hypothetical protein
MDDIENSLSLMLKFLLAKTFWKIQQEKNHEPDRKPVDTTFTSITIIRTALVAVIPQ